MICASCGLAIGPDEDSYSMLQDEKTVHEHAECLARDLGCTVDDLPSLIFPDAPQAPERSEA